jgi:hypothetical protein
VKNSREDILFFGRGMIDYALLFKPKQLSTETAVIVVIK